MNERYEKARIAKDKAKKEAKRAIGIFEAIDPPASFLEVSSRARDALEAVFCFEEAYERYQEMLTGRITPFVSYFRERISRLVEHSIQARFQRGMDAYLNLTIKDHEEMEGLVYSIDLALSDIRTQNTVLADKLDEKKRDAMRSKIREAIDFYLSLPEDTDWAVADDILVKTKKMIRLTSLSHTEKEGFMMEVEKNEESEIRQLIIDYSKSLLSNKEEARIISLLIIKKLRETTLPNAKKKLLLGNFSAEMKVYNIGMAIAMYEKLPLNVPTEIEADAYEAAAEIFNTPCLQREKLQGSFYRVVFRRATAAVEALEALNPRADREEIKRMTERAKKLVTSLNDIESVVKPEQSKSSDLLKRLRGAFSQLTGRRRIRG